MEAWRSEDDTRWIDYNGRTESDGCIRIYDGFPTTAPPALVTGSRGTHRYCMR